MWTEGCAGWNFVTPGQEAALYAMCGKQVRFNDGRINWATLMHNMHSIIRVVKAVRDSMSDYFSNLLMQTLFMFVLPRKAPEEFHPYHAIEEQKEDDTYFLLDKPSGELLELIFLADIEGSPVTKVKAVKAAPKLKAAPAKPAKQPGAAKRRKVSMEEDVVTPDLVLDSGTRKRKVADDVVGCLSARLRDLTEEP